MLRRRVVVALVVAALTALALSVGSHVATDQRRNAASAAEAVLTAPVFGLEAVARIEPQNGREWVTSHLKQRLVLLAAAAAILGSPALARRRAVTRARARRPLVAWLATHGSRAPPQLQLLTP